MKPDTGVTFTVPVPAENLSKMKTGAAAQALYSEAAREIGLRIVGVLNVAAQPIENGGDFSPRDIIGGRPPVQAAVRNSVPVVTDFPDELAPKLPADRGPIHCPAHPLQYPSPRSPPAMGSRDFARQDIHAHRAFLADSRFDDTPQGGQISCFEKPIGIRQVPSGGRDDDVIRANEGISGASASVRSSSSLSA